MYSINHSQNGLSTASGACIRGYKKAVKAIIQEDPVLLKSFLEIPSRKLKTIIDKAKYNIMTNLASLSSWQPPVAAFDVDQKSDMKSNETYFENNHGFKEAELLVKPIMASYTSPTYRFMSKNVHSPFITSVRGFKTRRAMDDWRPFTKKKAGSETETEDFLGILGKSGDAQKIELDKLSGILQQAELSPEEKNKLYATINAFAIGYASGKGEPDSVSPIVGSTGSKMEIGSLLSKKGSQKKSFSRAVIWEKIWKFALILGIMTSFVFLQRFGVLPSIRFSGASNEIAPEEIDARFEDVKGCDEAKQELQEIVEFLMNPDKFSSLGGKLPKGVLLSGPPGTGKTLLAKAVAGQAGVPFFHAAGSEFDEVLVGQGARRVRDLFRAAKARAPCVVFIDEIDSVGGKRSSSVLHPYANQTINQLLSEMDGFRSNEGIIVLGATNRPGELDKALMRPGRFDTQVTVAVPDVKGRKELLELYLNKVKCSDEIDIDKWSRRTIGFSGADIQNLVNTAAIRAAVEGKEHVTMADIEYAYDKQVMGSDLKSRVRDADDIKLTAYHEAGHTLVAFFTKDARPVHKVTIVAKGKSGGHTAFLPEKDSMQETKSQLVAMLDVGMGGRAAEELIFGKEMVTGGASSDFSNATRIAEEMVKRLGMSEKLGFRVFSEEKLADGRVGDSTKVVIDDEVNSLLNESYKRAMSILKSHRREMDALAEALINHETLDAEDVKAICQGKRLFATKEERVNRKQNNAANSQTTKMFKPKPIVVVVPPNVEQSPNKP